MKHLLRPILCGGVLAALLCIFMNGIDCHAQFKEEAFSQQYNSDTTSTSGNCTCPKRSVNSANPYFPVRTVW